ncbi:MAG: transposase [Thermodesulfovibrionales bacterium]
MVRIARIVTANLLHYITQRGNRRQRTFFQDEDYRLYRSLMAEWCNNHTVEVWAYCLMPNHVHLVDNWRVSRADRYGVENPAQRQRATRIKYGVPGTNAEPDRRTIDPARFASFE